MELFEHVQIQFSSYHKNVTVLHSLQEDEENISISDDPIRKEFNSTSLITKSTHN